MIEELLQDIEYTFDKFNSLYIDNVSNFLFILKKCPYISDKLEKLHIYLYFDKDNIILDGEHSDCINRIKYKFDTKYNIYYYSYSFNAWKVVPNYDMQQRLLIDIKNILESIK